MLYTVYSIHPCCSSPFLIPFYPIDLIPGSGPKVDGLHRGLRLVWIPTLLVNVDRLGFIVAVLDLVLLFFYSIPLLPLFLLLTSSHLLYPFTFFFFFCFFFLQLLPVLSIPLFSSFPLPSPYFPCRSLYPFPRYSLCLSRTFCQALSLCSDLTIRCTRPARPFEFWAVKNHPPTHLIRLVQELLVDQKERARKAKRKTGNQQSTILTDLGHPERTVDC